MNRRKLFGALLAGPTLARQAAAASLLPQVPTGTPLIGLDGAPLPAMMVGTSMAGRIGSVTLGGLPRFRYDESGKRPRRRRLRAEVRERRGTVRRT